MTDTLTQRTERVALENRLKFEKDRREAVKKAEEGKLSDSERETLIKRQNELNQGEGSGPLR